MTLTEMLPRLRRGSEKAVVYDSPQPQFSPRFQEQMQGQLRIDSQAAQLSLPEKPRISLSSGGDHRVEKVNTPDGPFVLKTFKPSSRAVLVFGHGVDPNDVPTSMEPIDRLALLAKQVKREIDPDVVARKARETHVLATTYLGDSLQPTAIFPEEGEIFRVQRFVSAGEAVGGTEGAVRGQSIRRHFETLRGRWEQAKESTDFAALDSDVQDFWAASPPDHGMGANVVFLGLDTLRVVDY